MVKRAVTFGVMGSRRPSVEPARESACSGQEVGLTLEEEIGHEVLRRARLPLDTPVRGGAMRIAAELLGEDCIVEKPFRMPRNLGGFWAGPKNRLTSL